MAQKKGNSRESWKPKKAQLYAFPGGRSDGATSANSPVWASPRLYRCQKCGNTRLFYGHAKVEATILISAVEPFRYDILQYDIDEIGPVNHRVISCAQCGSTDIVAYDVDVAGAKLTTNDVVLGRRVIILDTDPLPPHEMDVVQGPDGRWYVGCQRTLDHIMVTKYLESTERDPNKPLPDFVTVIEEEEPEEPPF